MRMRLAAFLVLSLAVPAFAFAADKEKDKEKKNDDAEVTIVTLYDSFGKDVAGTTQDFGFSALVTYKGKTILFDSGANADTFKKNAQAMGVDLKKIDFAVASHDHFDHVNGFDWLLEVNPKVKIYYPNDRWGGAPTTFDLAGRNPDIAKQLPPEQQYFGGKKAGVVPLQSSGRFWKANVEYVAESKEIAPGISLIATTSTLMGHFTKYPGTITDPNADPIYEDKYEGLPELSLALQTSKGEVIIAGCSHSSVDLIAITSKNFVKRDLYAMVGGLHLIPYDATFITGQIKRMRENYGIKKIAPGHCTGHLAFKLLRDTYGADYVLAGLGSKIEL